MGKVKNKVWHRINLTKKDDEQQKISFLFDNLDLWLMISWIVFIPLFLLLEDKMWVLKTEIVVMGISLLSHMLTVAHLKSCVHKEEEV